MKEIMFRPLRRVKKTGKIVVAAYTQWNRVRTADYGAFELTIDREYADLPADEQVYNHEGEPLFWRDFEPEEIPVYTTAEMKALGLTFEALHQGGAHHGILWNAGGPVHYTCKGLDCQGTPTFSHHTMDDVAEHSADWVDYEPLTVGVVVKWYAWFLCQLQNASLQVR